MRFPDVGVSGSRRRQWVYAIAFIVVMVIGALAAGKVVLAIVSVFGLAVIGAVLRQDRKDRIDPSA